MEEIIPQRRDLTSPSQNYMTLSGFEKVKDKLTHGMADSITVIDPAAQKSDKVLFGATVTVQDDDENTKVYKLVGVDEADVSVGKISWISPIAKALLGSRVGSVVTIRLPKGEEDLEVLKIEYKQID